MMKVPKGGIFYFNLVAKISILTTIFFRIASKHWKNYGTKIVSHASCARKTLQKQKLGTMNMKENHTASHAIQRTHYQSVRVVRIQSLIEQSKLWEGIGMYNV